MSYDDDYQEKYIEGLRGAKRATIVWTPWMGDWFTSHSPRNGNENAEGTWEHWVELSLSILQHPATALVRPDIHAAVESLEGHKRYSETERPLTEEEVVRLFGEREPSDAGGDS